MTFIASVVAKKGVAIIADSLVTSQSPILHYRQFLEYIEELPNNENDEKVVNPDDLRRLFNSEPIYTKDYEEKLFSLNPFIAITTAGNAYINGKNIADLIDDFKNLHPDVREVTTPVTEILQLFKDFINQSAREHLGKFSFIGTTLFLITFYEKHLHKTHIYRASVNESDEDSLNDPDYDYLSIREEPDWITVACEGQNKISEKILYGVGREIYTIFAEFVGEVLKRLNLPEGAVPEDFIDQLKQDEYFRNIFYGDLELLNLNNLSLQQAVDLASLLMRLEVDFQKYTKNIPTVGGVIKLAVIDEEGFRFISGNNVEVPKHINY